MSRLSVEGLAINLGDRRGPDVVADVTFRVNAGEVLGLVGESGSGKTSVALALLGYARRGLTISSGKVILDGTDLLALQPKELRAVRGIRAAYVPQDPAAALNPALRIRTQLEEALRRCQGEGASVDDRLAEVAEQVRIPSDREYLRRYPHQLSGGQQQRVALAMAFVGRPSLIVLDEPTTGLDVSTQRHILDIVTELCSLNGVAAVYVSHDLAVVRGLATQVAVMYAGRTVEVGPTERVFANPVHPYTRRLLAAIPSPERSEVLRGIDGEPPRPGSRPRGCSFAPRCDFALQACVDGEPPLTEVAGRLVRCVRAGEDLSSDVARVQSVPHPSSAQSRILRVSDLRASYGRTEVLHGVSVEVAAESCLAIVGESGSGKTTLARCIVGLHPSLEGSVLLDGVELPHAARRRPKEALRRVQYIFQNPYTALNPRKTIGDIIAEPLGHFFDLNRTDRESRVRDALHSVSLLGDSVSRYPDQLSGGERQRVAIARALVVEPDLLVCDEVTSALDVSVQAIIIELLRRLQVERRLSMIFITHNLALVRSIAQSVAVLSDGNLVEVGAVDDVLDRPKASYTAALLADAPKLTEFPARL
jgi:peptide/nickel transport system ATP-binding protein